MESNTRWMLHVKGNQIGIALGIAQSISDSVRRHVTFLGRTPTAANPEIPALLFH